jgi:DNA-binding transcriptional MerR regulator
MTTDDVLRHALTTTEAAERSGLTRQGILRRVTAGTLEPLYRQPANGGYLFDAADIEVAL